MSDTLEIFGKEYTNVAGFKATDDNDNILTYIRPQGIDGNNLEYGLIDGTMLLVGVAKVDQAEI